jgi:two-component system chemotaxis response regulator CheY
MKILLVDDSKLIRNVQKKFLEANPSVEFLEAGDGVEALSVLASAGPVEMALVDWNMPNMDGHTLVKKIRETDKRILLIMCTTEAEKPRIMEALKAGVNNYLVKPFTGESLIEKVQATLKRATQTV